MNSIKIAILFSLFILFLELISFSEENTINLVDSFKILGIPTNATDSEIIKARNKAAKKYHPDLNQGKSEKEIKDLKDKMQLINLAYKMIMQSRESVHKTNEKDPKMEAIIKRYQLQVEELFGIDLLQYIGFADEFITSLKNNRFSNFKNSDLWINLIYRKIMLTEISEATYSKEAEELLVFAAKLNITSINKEIGDILFFKQNLKYNELPVLSRELLLRNVSIRDSSRILKKAWGIEGIINDFIFLKDIVLKKNNKELVVHIISLILSTKDKKIQTETLLLMLKDFIPYLKMNEYYKSIFLAEAFLLNSRFKNEKDILVELIKNIDLKKINIEDLKSINIVLSNHDAALIIDGLLLRNNINFLTRLSEYREKLFFTNKEHSYAYNKFHTRAKTAIKIKHDNERFRYLMQTSAPKSKKMFNIKKTSPKKCSFIFQKQIITPNN